MCMSFPQCFFFRFLSLHFQKESRCVHLTDKVFTEAKATYQITTLHCLLTLAVSFTLKSSGIFQRQRRFFPFHRHTFSDRTWNTIRFRLKNMISKLIKLNLSLCSNIALSMQLAANKKRHMILIRVSV